MAGTEMNVTKVQLTFGKMKDIFSFRQLLRSINCSLWFLPLFCSWTLPSQRGLLSMKQSSYRHRCLRQTAKVQLAGALNTCVSPTLSTLGRMWSLTASLAAALILSGLWALSDHSNQLSPNSSWSLCNDVCAAHKIFNPFICCGRL